MTVADASEWSVARPAASGLSALAIFAVLFGAWAASAPIDGVIVARATIGAAQHYQPVLPPYAGAVEHVFVTEGQHVAAGDVLLQMESGDVTAEIAGTGTRRLQMLAVQARLTALGSIAGRPVWPTELSLAAAQDPAAQEAMANETAALAASRAEEAARVTQYRIRRAAAEAERASLESAAAALTREQSLLQAELAARTALSRHGLAVSASVLGLRRESLQTASRISRNAADLLAAEAALQSLILEQAEWRAATDKSVADDIRDSMTTLTELSTRLRQLRNARRQLTLHAPVGGHVLGLIALARGSVLRMDTPVMTIVPEGDTAVAVAAVPASASASLRPGLQVRLRIENARRPDPIAGTVSRVSRAPGRDGQAPAYLAEIRISPEAAAAARLRSGMAADVFIPSGTDTALGLFTAPLADAVARVLGRLPD